MLVACAWQYVNLLQPYSFYNVLMTDVLWNGTSLFGGTRRVRSRRLTHEAIRVKVSVTLVLAGDLIGYELRPPLTPHGGDSCPCHRPT
jgi:hypothetical protein